jgi:hypothetical protein
MEKNRKLNQLTDSLKSTYSHIKPTIIQGQRIQKVINEMESKIDF